MTPMVQMSMAGPPSSPPAPVVFVSHTSPDKARFVQPFARRLRERGIRVWLDETEIRPGDSLVRKIFVDGIESADVMVVVLSRFSADSEWMPVELDAAYARKVAGRLRIVTVRLDDVPVPTALAGDYWVSIDPAADWSAQFEQLHRAIVDPSARDAVARRGDDLRWMLADPSRWIEAYDLVTEKTDAALWRLGQSHPEGDGSGDLGGQVQRRLDDYDLVMSELDEALALCGCFGDPEQKRLWSRPLQRVLRTAAHSAAEADGEAWQRLAWYPPLRLSYAVGVAAVAGGREGVLRSLVTQQVPTVRQVRPAWQALALHRVLDPAVAGLIPGCAGSHDALSIHLRRSLRPAFAGILADGEYADTFARFEYLRTLLELDLSDGRLASLGEFAWSLHNHGTALPGLIASEVRALGPSWPLLRAGAFGGDPDAVLRAQSRLHGRVERRFEHDG